MKSNLIPSTPVPESSSFLPYRQPFYQFILHLSEIFNSYASNSICTSFCVCASNMLKSLGCFHLVDFVIVHFGNYSLFSTTAGYFFVWLGLRLFLQSSIWASAVLLIYCYYNKDSRNSLSAGVRLLASFSFVTILSLAWPDTVLSCLS